MCKTLRRLKKNIKNRQLIKNNNKNSSPFIRFACYFLFSIPFCRFCFILINKIFIIVFSTRGQVIVSITAWNIPQVLTRLQMEDKWTKRSLQFWCHFEFLQSFRFFCSWKSCSLKNFRRKVLLEISEKKSSAKSLRCILTLFKFLYEYFLELEMSYMFEIKRKLPGFLV